MVAAVAGSVTGGVMVSATRVQGVLLSSVNEGVLRESLQFYKLDAHGALQSRVERLAKHIRSVTPKSNLADCSTSGGDSDIRLPQCSYCGDGDAEVTHVELVSARPQHLQPVSARFSEADLDQAVAEVRRLRGRVAASCWDLGRAIYAIYERRMYDVRRDPLGRSLYKTWDQFCYDELGYTPQYSYRLMWVSLEFSREDAESLGVSKLSMVLQVPKAERQKILDKARAGVTRDVLMEEIRKLAFHTTRWREDNDKAGTLAQSSPATRSETATIPLGRHVLPLFARPALRPESGNEPGGPTRRAATIGDDPWAVLQLADGNELYFVVVQDSAGKMELVVEVRKR